MSKTKEKAAEADIAQKADMIDPDSTAPSKDPNHETVAAEATATERNSKERIGQKVTRTGRNNGGDGDTRGRPGLNTDLTADRLGEREAVSPAAHDVIWTNASKDRWGADQPDLSKLLAQRNTVTEKLAEEK